LFFNLSLWFEIEIDDDRSVNHRSIVEKIMERVKKPHNYGLSAEEEEIAKKKELLEKEKREREEREEREREEQEATNNRMKKEKEWATKLDQVKREQHQILDTQSLPLRNYLMAHVMPTLTKALIGIGSDISLISISIYSVYRVLSSST
jgi:adenylate kinase